MSDLLLPVAAATGTQPAVVIKMGAAQQREDRPATFSGCDPADAQPPRPERPSDQPLPAGIGVYQVIVSLPSRIS
jgi:hypothetical protein